MRTLIVDDQTLFGQSLKFLLEDLHPGMVCETASTLAGVLAGGIYVPTFALQYVPPHTLVNGCSVAAFSSADTDFLNSRPVTTDAVDSETGAPLRQLSKRQIDCLLMAAQGKSNRLIASELFLAESTVKTHVMAAFKILDVRTRAEAVFKAASLGLLPSSARHNNL
ncbi:MAG: helix-turn-helix transcriptional regulator [Hydrogenophaga sp.]|uniref:response regulator transcription factor n=1 Tax=Hydrogenophaga sp. TaxID=1904254 RepID=UPI002ABB3AA7|nr:helix-turn-helix transcriptional regulator [Hydrogenophaga sp.]MDZ4186836.1 helix-turn-helix transcriptional regulator [Hydrogenophaga sp.]